MKKIITVSDLVDYFKPERIKVRLNKNCNYLTYWNKKELPLWLTFLNFENYYLCKIQKALAIYITLGVNNYGQDYY